MSFSFGAKPTTTAAAPTAGTGGGFSFGGAGGTAAGGGGFSFGAAPKTTATPAPAAGGFSFGGGGGLGGATPAPVASSASGGFSFGTPGAGVAQATTTATGGGFSLGGGTALGGGLGGTPAQTSAGGGFNLGGVSALGGAKTQAAPATGFSLGGTTTAAATTAGGFSLGGAPSLGGAATTLGGVAPSLGGSAPSLGGVITSTPAAGGFKLGGTTAPTATASTIAATTAAAGGFKLGGTATGGLGLGGAAPTGGLGLGGAAPTGGLGLGGGTTTGGLGLGGGLGGTTLTTATPGLTSILKTTGTAAAPAANPGLSLTMPTKTTAAAPTGLTLGGGLVAKPTTTAATAAATSTTGAAATTGPKMSYQELEHAISKWTVELEDQEKIFLKQATQVNAWDRLLIENGEKITSLHNDMEKVKADQQRLEHELDYIVAQQRELEDMLVPLEETVATQQQGSIYTQHADLERERTYQLAENTDGQLKRMVQDLKDIIDHLNTANTPLDSNDPMNQIAKILNAHMDSLQWIDQNTVMLQRKVDEVAKQCDVVRRDQERNVHLAFD